MNKNPEVIDNSQEHECYRCSGTGKVFKDDGPASECPTCKGTGKWREDHYHIVATTSEGQRIAFDSDFGGK